MSLENIVAVAASERPEYGRLRNNVPSPELPAGQVRTVAQLALRDLFQSWELDPERFGTPEWNPLGVFIPPGCRVVVKPNWVLHQNESGQGLDCLLTHASLIEAILEYAALAHPGAVVLGDAPIQRCDFNALRIACGLDPMVQRFRSRGMNLELRDFRRTMLIGRRLRTAQIENLQAVEDFVLCDLKTLSLLEPLAREAWKFRVTMYDPDLLQRTHGPGKHQYLIARDCLAAQVVINLPKLKCHKKAGITGALKNLVGINGNKEYLPHHRKGGRETGGDCYAGESWLKRRAEELFDAANRRRQGTARHLFGAAAGAAARLAQAFGADDNLEGSWHGNDTVWRTCLDLQRILRYGRDDGTLSSTVQRHVISITDAIVAGEGDGPLAPTPVPAGFLTGAVNPAAAEWVHARLMGFDPVKIPLVREAFSDFPYPLAEFPPSDIRVRMRGQEQGVEDLHPFARRSFRPSKGWENHCELACDHDPANRESTLVA